MPELLLELLSEEIPARMQARAAEDLKRLVMDKLKEGGLAFTAANAYATPRRLTLVVDGLPTQQPDVEVEIRGPRVGAPEAAINGFLKARGLTSLDQCKQRDTGKGTFWFVIDLARGSPISNAVIEPLRVAIRALPWPKSMRCASHRLLWVRPLHGILAIVGDSEIALDINLDVADAEESFSSKDANVLRAGRNTVGHRFLRREPFAVHSF